MDRTITNVISGNHELKMVDRSQILFTGIKKIDSFDNEEFLIESTMGIILLKGENLEIIKLDTHDGNVKIKGKINSIAYLDDKPKNKEEGILAKLFKWWILKFRSIPLFLVFLWEYFCMSLVY